MASGAGPADLGGDYTVIQANLTVSGADAEIAPNDPTRVAILFSVGGTAASLVVTTRAAGVTTWGFQVPLDGYLEFTWSKHGTLPTFGWYLENAEAGKSITVTTVQYRPTGQQNGGAGEGT